MKKFNLSSYGALFTIGTVFILIACVLNIFSFIESAAVSLIVRLIIFLIGAFFIVLASRKKDTNNQKIKK